MNAHRLAFTPVVLALLVSMVGSLFWRPALAEPPITNLRIAIEGTVKAQAENVFLSGRAHITSTLVTDPDFGTQTSVILAINLFNVSGVGLSTKGRYIATGENDVIRLLVPVDLVEVSFPFFPTGPGGSGLARPALASFSLTFDVNNGQLKEATANFTTPNF